ncbi:MAG TPA: pyridoxal-phosphate dependent enzyme [Bacteroidetes bacterium]|nr:pyridoxal-phosphate dependent enzyme [Bacteroidota bacterium]
MIGPCFQDIVKASERIRSFIHKTPVLYSSSINGILDSKIYFKCENFQKAGAFKFRGASHAVSTLNEILKKKGVATHSSGNHAAALALAATMHNIPSYIVMPENAPRIKKLAVAGYGAKIFYCSSTLEAREQTLKQVVNKTGAIFIHPYDNEKVIAGQGTSALELLDQTPALDIVIAPVGGGGLLSGTAITVKHMSPTTKIFGAEPAGADDAARSFYSGKLIPSLRPQTIADGLLTSLSERTFAIIRQNVDNIMIVREETIIQAMRMIWERMKIIVEPSAAVPFAAVIEHNDLFRHKTIGIILSGGNVDLDHLPF